jgi:hypothetical protein
MAIASGVISMYALRTILGLFRAMKGKAEKD